MYDVRKARTRPPVGQRAVRREAVLEFLRDTRVGTVKGGVLDKEWKTSFPFFLGFFFRQSYPLFLSLVRLG